MGDFLRVEALNIGATVLDTDQLSVIRGGSLLLRKVVASCATQLRDAHWEPVREGGEAIVFRAPEGADVQAMVQTLRAQVETAQPRDLDATHFRVLVVAVRANEHTAIEASLAAIRWRQMRLPTQLAEPAGEHRQPCKYNRVRAATTRIHTRNDEGPIHEYVCASVARRHDYGRAVRQNELLQTDGDSALQKFHAAHSSPPPTAKQTLEQWRGQVRKLVFSNDLGQLSKRGPYPQLEGKIAVLSLDGNAFGKRQAKLAPEEKHSFDVQLNSWRAALLGELLYWLSGSAEHPCGRLRTHADVPHPHKTTDTQVRLRLEVLRWAGDEIVLLLPAWLGLEALARVMDANAGWICGQSAGADRAQHFSVSAGLLLCHHKMPVVRAIELSERVLASAKQASKASVADDTLAPASWDYLVLESMDFPATLSLEEFWSARLGTANQRRCPLLAGAGSLERLQQLQQALEQLPRRKIYAAALAQLNASHPWVLAQQIEPWMTGNSGDDAERAAVRHTLLLAQQLLGPCLPDKTDMHWVHLRELLDYLCPRVSMEAAGKPA